MVPDLVAVVALNLDVGLARLAARTAGTFELTREILEEGRVPGQALDNRHRLALSSSLLDPEPSGDPVRYGFVHSREAAAALLRPTAFRTHPTLVGGVDGSRFLASAHPLQLN